MSTPVAPTSNPQPVEITDEHVLDVIRRTNHIGAQHAEGFPNNSSESMVENMAAALRLMLAGYKQGSAA